MNPLQFNLPGYYKMEGTIATDRILHDTRRTIDCSPRTDRRYAPIELKGKGL